MKKHFLLLLVSCCFFAHAQKDHSLFWEISGNGLAKKSYLYGTMHVNEKISFRLSDAFFEHLLAADIVSNESNPESWGELIDLFDVDEKASSYKFYTEFYLSPIQKEAVASAFVSNNYFNKTLDDIEGTRADFQESTVLDMFIFQTGKKYKKKIIGLEDAKSSVLMLLQLKPEDLSPVEPNKTALLKLVKNKSFTEVLKQYYREKDVVMLDSLYRLMFSQKGHKALIVDRNAIMARSLDSLARTGSVFAGVGAAHLAGKQGIIQMLRNKGYTVKPIIDEFSDVGRNKKKTIEDFFPNPNYKATVLDDQMVSVPLNNYTLFLDKEIVSPDYASGAATTIKRIPLYDFLQKDAKPFDHKVLDSLFFENIPGDILGKNYFETGSYRGYDIKNVTKTGNHQHYRFYLTPLELIAVSMVGNGNYVRQYEAAVFDKIKLRPFASAWEKLEPRKGGFTVDLPSYHLMYGNDTEKPNNIEIQAYDDTEKGYYFLLERTLDDTRQLEDTAFEHRQIHQEFYLQHSIDTLKTAYDKNGLISESLLGSRKIRLKTVIQGPKYYLLGTVNASDANSDRFFHSFATAPFRYSGKVKTYRDTIAHFNIDIPEKANPKLFLHIDDREFDMPDEFSQSYRKYTFLSGSGKSVDMEFNTYNKYQKPQPLDSLRAGFRKGFLREYDAFPPDYEYHEDQAATSLLEYQTYRKPGLKESTWPSLIDKPAEKYEMLSEKESFDSANNIRTFEAVVSKPGSQQAIRYQVLWRPDRYFTFKTLADKNDLYSDVFVEQTFHSLAFSKAALSSATGNNILDFIKDARSENDTIRESALGSTYSLELETADFDNITAFASQFNFREDESAYFANLLIEIGGIKDERVVNFMEQIYKRNTSSATIKVAALTGLARQKSKAACKKILELMQQDLPLLENHYSLTRLFDYLEEDTENSKILVPALPQFYKTEEYKLPIIGLCNTLIDSGQITAKSLGSFRKTLANDANLKYKRLADRSKMDDEEDYDYSSTELVEYVNLLSKFPKDKEIDKLFHHLNALDDKVLKAEMLRLGVRNNRISEAEIDAALQAKSTRFLMLQLLLNQNNRSFMDQLTDEQIAEAAVYNFGDLTQKDSVSLVHKQIVLRNGKPTTYFFHRLKIWNPDTEDYINQLHTVAFVNDGNRINPEAFTSVSYVSDPPDEQLEQQYKTIINASLHEDHWRASFSKREPTNEEIIPAY
ncbi:TraB/GumN family protein [Flavobacterium sp.]|uniref:TraB/GumN family protein n=1 Tax=Flavobacterium sp. TaxID=239 RepID=UPI0039E463A8